MEKEFEWINFNSQRLENRFWRAMATGHKHPDESILGCSKNRAEAKAIYRMPDNDRFDSLEMPEARQAAAIERITGEKVIPAVQDTTSLNYNTHEKTEGVGYISGKTKDINIHSCIAVTPDGLVEGVLDQSHYSRERAKDDTLTKGEKKNRPIEKIEKKESCRRPVTMDNVCGNILDEIKVKNNLTLTGEVVRSVKKFIIVEVCVAAHTAKKRLRP